MPYERLLNKTATPTNQDILDTIGEKSHLWIYMNQFIEENYDFNKELAFFSKNYGWTVRYRKSNKTLVSCFPEDGAFSVLLVLGQKESDKVNEIRDKLNENFLSVFDSTEQLRDGRWMWIRILKQEDLDSILKVIQVKRRVKK
jgi:hypothetical protein